MEHNIQDRVAVTMLPVRPPLGLPAEVHGWLGRLGQFFLLGSAVLAPAPL